MGDVDGGALGAVDGDGVSVAFTGPAVIEEETATTVLPPGWQGRVDDLGNLVLTPAS